MTVKEYVETLTKYLEEHPECAELTAVMCIDAENSIVTRDIDGSPFMKGNNDDYSEFYSEDQLIEDEESFEDYPLNAVIVAAFEQ